MESVAWVIFMMTIFCTGMMFICVSRSDRAEKALEMMREANDKHLEDLYVERDKMIAIFAKAKLELQSLVTRGANDASRRN